MMSPNELSQKLQKIDKRLDLETISTPGEPLIIEFYFETGYGRSTVLNLCESWNFGHSWCLEFRRNITLDREPNWFFPMLEAIDKFTKERS